jgi:hypothetical protein
MLSKSVQLLCLFSNAISTSFPAPLLYPLLGVALVQFSPIGPEFNAYLHPVDYKFDLMYSKRAFVHWYVGEGMEEVSRIQSTRPQLSLYSTFILRVSSRKRARISQRSRRITRKSAPTPWMRKKRQLNISLVAVEVFDHPEYFFFFSFLDLCVSILYCDWLLSDHDRFLQTFAPTLKDSSLCL